MMDSFSSLSGSVGRDVDGNRGYDMGPMFPGKMYIIPNAPPGVDPCYFVPECKPGEGGCQILLTAGQRNCLAYAVHEELEPVQALPVSETTCVAKTQA